MKFVDSHMHLTEYPQPEQILAYASASETLLFTASVDEATSHDTLALGRKYSETVRPFVGVHPSEARKGPKTDWLVEAIGLASGVGEIGLDPTYSEISESGPQAEVFTAQLELSEAAEKPVQVHTRRAEGMCIQKLQSYNLGSVLLHWFEGEELASRAASCGYYISFGPALLYSKKLRRIAAGYPTDLILSESDGPVAFAALGGPDGPPLVPSVIFRMAQLKKKGYPEMAEIVLRNGLTYLGEGRKDRGSN
jgi:TatD DNase family protein